MKNFSKFLEKMLEPMMEPPQLVRLEVGQGICLKTEEDHFLNLLGEKYLQEVPGKDAGEAGSGATYFFENGRGSFFEPPCVNSTNVYMWKSMCICKSMCI